MPPIDTLTPALFNRIAVMAKARWGLSMNQSKMQLVTSRLQSHMRSSSFADVESYINHIEQTSDEKDLLEFFDILSTNVTSFFRDKSHFDYLERELLTGLARGTITLPGKKLRLWSAGCSTGCEPYTMAMVVHPHLKSMAGWDVQILATDLSNYAVDEARAGRYDRETIKSLPPSLLEEHFEQDGDRWATRQHLRDIIKVAQLNLMDQWSMKGPFDVIFCRNVMIYFDAPTREKLIRRFLGLLRPGGIFAVGSAETLTGLSLPVKAVLPSLYIKE